MNKVNSEESPTYNLNRLEDEDAVISEALMILTRRTQSGKMFNSPDLVSNYLIAKISQLEHEVFGCMFLDNQHQLLKDEELFRGTIDGASVYPREVAKAALQYNAKAVVFYHNHPSGVPEPSQADRALTEKLQEALQLFEIRVLDHIIVGGTDTISFAERGLI